MTASPAAVQRTLATLRASPALFGPPGEPWAGMMGRIATPGHAAEVDQESYD